MSNKNKKLYDDLKKTKPSQQTSNNSNKVRYNPFKNNLNQINNLKNQVNNFPISLDQRNTVGTPFPSDNTDTLFDLKSTNSVLGFIPPEPRNSIPSIQIKKINKKGNITNKNYNNKTVVNIKNNNIDDFSQKRKSPMDDISNNSSSNNRKIQLTSTVSNSDKNKSNISSNINLKSSTIRIQFMNRNIDIFGMLEKIQFFERLDSIGKERMNTFEKEFRKDIFFMKKDFFDNNFIKESEIDKFSPLTLIFHFIFNPETKIMQLPPKKSFFESIFQQRGDKNIKINYSPNDLKLVPKYFNDFTYVNNLFNNFNEIELNNFIEEIKKWKKFFSFELQFVHPLNNNLGKSIGQNQIEINDVVKIYFISPNDLIVDYHTYAENFPLSDSFVPITQYNFHCDINYDRDEGRFIFITSSIVYNKLQIVNQNIIQNVIKKEAKGVIYHELLVNTWKPLLNIIKEESKKNKIITDKIFKEYLRKNLNRYSKNKPEIKIENISNQNNIKKKNDSNQNKKEYENINNINANDIFEKTISSIEENNEKKDNDIVDNNSSNEKNKASNNSNQEENEQNLFLFYGVLVTFFLFIFKTILNIEYGNYSLETFFNVLIIIVIGFMLIKNYIIDKNNNNIY